MVSVEELKAAPLEELKLELITLAHAEVNALRLAKGLTPYSFDEDEDDETFEAE